MGAAASCGICLGTTFALCTTAAQAPHVHQPVGRRDSQDGRRRHGHDKPGHGGADPDDARQHTHARGPKLVEDHGPYKKKQDAQGVLEKAHQRQVAMDREHAKHPPDQRDTAAQHPAKDKQGKKHHHDRGGTGGMGGPQRPISAEDKEFLRMFFAAEDAKQGKGSSHVWQDQDSLKEVFYKDHDGYMPKSREIHEAAAVKYSKRIESGTKKNVDAMLDRHGHHEFMRQNSVKGKRGNAAAARLQQDHISDSHSALGKKIYARPGSPKTSHNAHNHHHPHHHDEWHRTSSHH